MLNFIIDLFIVFIVLMILLINTFLWIELILFNSSLRYRLFKIKWLKDPARGDSFGEIYRLLKKGSNRIKKFIN